MARRELAAVAGVHVAAIVAIWLVAVCTYVVVFATPQPVWLAIDGVLIAGCAYLVHRQRDRLGFRSLGEHRLAKLAGLAVLATVCVTVTQLLIADQVDVWIDESAYLATMREGRIIREGMLPFNLRWLAPILAGPLNILPTDDVDALKALNFGGLVVAATLLALFAVRMRVTLVVAFAAPVFLLCSYLGVYAATNRLVLDPFNYALFAVLLHTLVRREHAAYFAIALLVTALGSEKAVYWIPIFPLVQLARGDRDWRGIAKATLLACGPTVLYLVAIRFYLRDSPSESQLFLEQLHHLSFTSLGGRVKNPIVALSSFRMLWFPFGGFTVFALLGFVYAERWMRPLALLLVPILGSVLIAYDTERMVAYGFIVYLPFGFVYLRRAAADLPSAVFATWLVLFVGFVTLAAYGLPLGLGKLLGGHARTLMWLSTLEVVLVGGLVCAHFMFWPPAQPREPLRA